MKSASAMSCKGEQHAQSDSALFEGLKRGDDQSYVQFVRTHTGRSLAVARRFLSEDEARDAVQEAFIKAFESIHRFRHDASLATWLHKIVVNCCLSRLRKKARASEVPIDDLLPLFDDDGHRTHPTSSWSLSVEAILEKDETRQLVRDLLSRLPEPHRTVLMLRDIEGFDSKETATMLNISVPAVKVRLHRARQAMREHLDPHFTRAS